MVNTYAVQSGGCRFESLRGFGFCLKGAHYEVDYCGKKTFLAGLQCTLTSSCAIMKRSDFSKPRFDTRKKHFRNQITARATINISQLFDTKSETPNQERKFSQTAYIIDDLGDSDIHWPTPPRLIQHYSHLN